MHKIFGHQEPKLLCFKHYKFIQCVPALEIKVMPLIRDRWTSHHQSLTINCIAICVFKLCNRRVIVLFTGQSCGPAYSFYKGKGRHRWNRSRTPTRSVIVSVNEGGIDPNCKYDNREERTRFEKN